MNSSVAKNADFEDLFHCLYNENEQSLENQSEVFDDCTTFDLVLDCLFDNLDLE